MITSELAPGFARDPLLPLALLRLSRYPRNTRETRRTAFERAAKFSFSSPISRFLSHSLYQAIQDALNR